MTHETRTEADGSPIRGEVTISVYDTDELREAVERELGRPYDDLGEYERWLASRDPDDFDLDALNYGANGLDRADARELLELTPPEADVEETTNTTVAGLHEYIVDNLDPNQATNLDCSHLAVGTDNTAPTTSESSLGTEAYRTAITDVIDNGNDLTTSTFLDSSEANGNTLVEVALYSASTGGTMFNRSLITAISKDNTKTATIDVELQFRAA